jgi:hypothetical protein
MEPAWLELPGMGIGGSRQMAQGLAYKRVTS